MRLILCTLLCFATGLPAASASDRDAELARYAEMAADGRCERAFESLRGLEFERAGEVDFDLLFAYCALETGETGLAMLALDRVLALEPANSSARFMLARAYYLLDDFGGARREFEALLALGPAPALGESVGRYLDALSARRPGDATRRNAYIALGLGHDTNVTDGTANDLVYFPGLNQDFRPAASEREDADDYANLAAGFDLVHRFDSRDGVYVGADVNLRTHDEHESLDYLLTGLRAGYLGNWGNQSLRAGIGVTDWRLDDTAYQDGRSLELEWRNVFARRNRIGIAGWYSRYRHDAAADEVMDYDDRRLRLAYSRVIGERGERLLGLAVDVGSEDDVNDRDDGNRDYVALRFSAQLAWSDRTSVFFVISSQKDDYRRENPLFSEKRSESQNQIAAGVVWSFREQTSLRATLVASDTESNFDLYDASSEDFSITLRRDFY